MYSSEQKAAAAAKRKAKEEQHMKDFRKEQVEKYPQALECTECGSQDIRCAKCGSYNFGIANKEKSCRT